MARITYVKKARQKFETKPVLDGDGKPLVQPVLDKHGKPKTNKHGQEITRKVTTNDITKPLPNETCDKCGVEIKPGDPYKHMSIKTSPYSSRRLVRCASCPSWQVWEYSYSLGAQIARVQFENDPSGADSIEEIRDILTNAADEIRSLAEEEEEKANNIEEGFGHETSMSEELRERGSELESWADTLSEWEADEDPGDEPEEDDFTDGTEEENEDEYAAKHDEWEQALDNARSSAEDLLNESPV